MLHSECPNGKYYEIQKTDSLVAIADKFGISLSELLKANPYFRPNFYVAGQIILIPRSEKNLYELGAADGLADILRKFNMSASELKHLNPDKDIFTLRAGDIIMVSENTQNTTYTIENGENLASLSKKFGLGELALLRANPHLRPQEFAAGRRIVLPNSDSH